MLMMEVQTALNSQETTGDVLPTIVKAQKKHRRGKKRASKSRHYPYAAKKCGDLINSDDQQTGKFRSGEVRPRYSPQAPRNYTQFIINDQNGNELKSDLECDTFDTVSSSEVDFATYIQAQFETDYKNARTTELAQMSKEELSDMVYQLEKKEHTLQKSHKNCPHCTSTPFANYQHSNHSDSDDHSDYESSCSSDSSFVSEGEEPTSDQLQNMLSSLQQQHDQLLEENQRLRTSQ